MEHQKITNFLDNASNQPSKFKTKNWVEINGESGGGCNINGIIKFKTKILKSSLGNSSDAYILVKGKITVSDKSAAGAATNNTNQKVIFKNCTPFTNYISEMNNTQVDNTKDIDTVSDNHSLFCELMAIL